MCGMGVTPIVFGNSDLWNAESCIFSTLGNRVHGTEWYESIRNNSGAAFTDQVFIDALHALYDLAAAGGFNSDINSVNGDIQSMYFMNADGAMTIDGS